MQIAPRGVPVSLGTRRTAARIWLCKDPRNRKRPAGEAGRFWGYYREERYVSLYMCGSVGGR